MADGKVVYKIVGDNGQFKKDVSQSEALASSSYSKIASAGKVAFAAIGAAVAAAGAAVVSLVKNSAEAYAEYEQLVGGVETLFKDSAETIQQYAENAYKTAGLSANKYMSTATGFSAALIQSLEGDTAKAAKYADLAIISMSDNANKMGTSMEDIQNAYQGFAKQNYTMLDNLKLGYGGTKEEMQRLLEEAEKLEGFAAGSLDITKFSDIVYAIDIVQDHMGIAGATAAEAMSTIQGSAAMTKAAWENLRVGIADTEANVGELVANFTSSFDALLSNVLPRVEIIVSSIPQLIGPIAQMLVEMAPELLAAGSEIINSLIALIVDTAPMLLEQGTILLVSLLEGLLSNTDQIATAVVTIVTTLASFLAENVGLVVEAAVTLALALIEALTEPEVLVSLAAAALTLIANLADALVNAMGNIVEAGATIIAKLLEFLASKVGDFAEKGKEFVSKLAEGIKNKVSNAKNAAADLIRQIVSNIKNKVTEFRNIGRDLFQGLIQGIKDKISSAISAVKDAVSNVINAAKNALGISSPSKVFIEMGEFVDEGFAYGIDKKKKAAINSALGMVGATVGASMQAFSPLASLGAVNNYSNSLNVAKLADSIMVRDSSDIDAISNALYQRILIEQRSRGLAF